MSKRQKKISIWSYIAKSKMLIILFSFLVIMMYAGNLVISIYSARFLTQVSTLNLEIAIKVLFILVILTLGQKFFDIVCDLVKNCVVASVAFNIKKDLMLRTMQINSKSFNDSSTGLFISRITQYPNEIITNLSKIIFNIFSILSHSIIIIFIAVINYWLAIVLVIGVLVCSIWNKYSINVFVKNSRMFLKNSEKIATLTGEMVRSEKDIKALGLEKQLSLSAEAKFKDFKKLYIKTNNTSHFMFGLEGVFIVLIISLTFFCGIRFMGWGWISLAGFLYIYTNRNAIEALVSNFGNLSASIADVKVKSEKVFEIYDEDNFVSEKFGNVNLNDFSGYIKFEKVKFSYSDKDEKTKKINKKIVLHDLNFEIKANTTVAFVGESGSGKSTILNLISKLYEADRGKILFDTTNVNDLTKDSLRANVSLVNQFPYIFDESIKNNLLMAKPDATEQEMISACKKADFWEFVQTHKRKLDTMVGENGIKLSGGQKQRLAIARALLRKSKVIIFDESTSALDNFSQEHIKKSIKDLKGNCTVIIVAHRLSTIENADMIFFLDKGQIVDKGTFNQLYQKNQKFRNMYSTEKL